MANNTIRYGLSGISRIGEDLIKVIISNRPYNSINDFLSKVHINKPQMINLIKSGAFDKFGDRIAVMHDYITSISETKKRITLQNMSMLINFDLIPNEYDMERRVFNFNKYLKKQKLDGVYYGMDNISFDFYSSNFEIDKLLPCEETESGFKISQTTWDNIYQHHMSIIRPYIQKHAADLLEKVNNKLIEDKWNKYCDGSISKWEMDSVSCYSHAHELSHVDMYRYGFSDFTKLPEEPEIDRIIQIKGKQVPMFMLRRICGTVLDKDKNKKTITLLTTAGVVTVKVYGGLFAQYDKQISERGADGKKHVIRKSEFARGNKIIVCGVRNGDSFMAKKYSKTPFHLVETIECINNDGTIETFSRNE